MEENAMHAADLSIKRSSTKEEKQRVLKKALSQVVEQLSIKRHELSAIIGFSESSLSRFFNRQDYYIDPFSKEGELALFLIRLYRSLDILFGGNTEKCRQWMQCQNLHLGAVPIEFVQTIPGLIHTVEYLDAMRGKN